MTQYGTKWFTFYTKIRPWLALVFSFGAFSDFFTYTDVYLENWWLLLQFLAGIVQIILGFVVFVKSLGYYDDFVRFVKGVLAYETVYIAYQFGVRMYITSELQFGPALIGFVVLLVLGYFLWCRLNIKYFEKRLSVPTPKPQEEAAQTEIFSAPPADMVCFCRVCGERLLNGSRFCRKCGTEITKEE